MRCGCFVFVAVAVFVVSPVHSAPKTAPATIHALIQESQGEKARDTIGNLMADVVAIQSAVGLTEEHSLVADLVARIDALREELTAEEAQDSVETAQRILELQSQLTMAQTVLAITPDQIREMEAMIESSELAGNETQAAILSAEELKEKFAKELNDARAVTDGLREQQRREEEKFNTDLHLVDHITDLLSTAGGCNVALATQFLSQLRTTASQLPPTFLELSSSTVDDDCATQYQGGGEGFCNDETKCTNPSVCPSCVFDRLTDTCYTPTTTTTTLCESLSRVLTTIREEIETSKRNDQLGFSNQIASLRDQQHSIDDSLQRTLNQLEGLQTTLAEVTERSTELRRQLQRASHVTVAEAQVMLVDIPQRIESERADRLARKEEREKEIGLIEASRTIVVQLVGRTDNSTTTRATTATGTKCLHFNRPGYYYHTSGPPPVSTDCPHDSKCGIERIVINPKENPASYIVRMGCLSDILDNQQLNFNGCGATTCPSNRSIYVAECCSGINCNSLEGSLGTRRYRPGQCDADACVCAPFIDGETKPSPFPSETPIPSPIPSVTPSASHFEPSRTPSQSVSVSPSPSATPRPHSCEALKSQFPEVESGIYQVSLGSAEGSRQSIYCDMSVDDSAGYTLLWKNVGGSLRHVTGLVNNKELLSGNRTDVVTPPAKSNGPADKSQFNREAFEFYANQPHTEWIKHMVLYENGISRRDQKIKVVMDHVTMAEVFETGGGAGHCVPTNGVFNVYASGDVAKPNTVSRFLGRTSVIDSGSEPETSFGLATRQEGRCPNVHISNLIGDTAPLARLTDDLQLGSNEGWTTIQHLFGYDLTTNKPRDFSRCMFRCWNGHDGMFHETFVWEARLGCPGFLFNSGQRCSGHGKCVAGVCSCDDGWTGDGCAAKRIAPTCGMPPSLENGVEDCDGNQCSLKCNEGYRLTGPATWECADSRQWVGPAVSQCEPICPKNCSGNGNCTDPGNCVCDKGWMGISCDSAACEPLRRIRYGSVECVDTSRTHECSISCVSGYRVEAGAATAQCVDGQWHNLGRCGAVCPQDCNNHGTCVAPNECQCYNGFKGDTCAHADCPNVGQCSGNGICVATDVCLCNSGYDGAACNLPVRDLNDIAMKFKSDGTQAIELKEMGTFSTLTFEVWVWPESVAGNQMLFEALETGTGVLSVGLSDSKVLVVVDGVKTALFSFSMHEKIWTHVGITVSAEKHVINLFIDGQKVDQVSFGGTNVVLARSRLGGTPSPSRTLFSGFMKEFRVWQTDRTEQQMSVNTFAALTGTDEELVALFPLAGPLSANAVYLDDLVGRFPVRVIGGEWARAPSAPPGPRQLPPVYHNAPIPTVN